MIGSRQWRIACALVSISAALAAPPVAALPLDSRVPGGVAVLRLPKVSGTPHAWLDKQPVWVARSGSEWVAIVGIGLDTPPGPLALRVSDDTSDQFLPFEITPKRYPEQRITLKDASRVSLSPENEARAIREIAEIQKIKRHWREEDGTDGKLAPPAEGRLVSRFGLRRFFNGEPRAAHSGQDIAVPRGTPVKAVAGGVVLAVGDYFFNGVTVFLDHGNGLISMVCHLDRSDVEPGQHVLQGQQVGQSGMTGRASGPHVHWSVVLNGTMVDPDLFLSAPRAKGSAPGEKRHGK